MKSPVRSCGQGPGWTDRSHQPQCRPIREWVDRGLSACACQMRPERPGKNARTDARRARIGRPAARRKWWSCFGKNDMARSSGFAVCGDADAGLRQVMSTCAQCIARASTRSARCADGCKSRFRWMAEVAFRYPWIDVRKGGRMATRRTGRCTRDAGEGRAMLEPAGCGSAACGIQRHSSAPDTAWRNHWARNTGAVSMRGTQMERKRRERLDLPFNALGRWRLGAAWRRIARKCRLFMTHLIKRQWQRER
jgi:hypothetical protein